MNPPPILRQQTVTEILDSAFRLYRDNFGTFLGILACVYVPLALTIMVLMGVVMNVVQSGGEAQAGMIVALVALAGGVVMFAFATPLATGALTRAVGDRYLNAETSIGRCYGYIFSIFGRYLGAILLAGIVIILGLFLCVIPGILFAIWFVFTSSVVVLEGHGGTQAMGRSRDLARGNAGRIIGLWFLIVVINWALGFGIGMFSGFILPKLVSSITMQFVIRQAIEWTLTMLLTPFYSVAWILLYYDIRIRKEGFDLEVLSKAMGKPAAFFPPPTATP